MIKGKSTIELFDGVTGKKTDEFINENMVTDVFKNMFSSFHERMPVAGINITTMLDLLTPLFPTYLRGILLWDRTIKEDPKIVIPPAGIKCIGHAGDQYFGLKATRGSYNVNESKTIDGGARWVWDFPTDRANGTIKSISLTSVLGGNAGWMAEAETGTHSFCRLHSDPSNPGSSSVLDIAPLGVSNSTSSYIFLGEFEKGVNTYVDVRNNPIASFIDQRFTNPSSIGIFDKTGKLHAEHTKETSFTIPLDSSVAITATNMTASADGIITVTTVTTSTEVAVRQIDVVNRRFLERKNIRLSEPISTTHPVTFFKDNVYAYSTVRAHLCSFDGLGNPPTELFNSTPVRFCVAGDYLITCATTSSTDCFITDGINHSTYRSGNAYGAFYNVSSFNLPFFAYHSSAINSNAVKSLGLLSTYLATINNLSSQVVKTNQHTMKVTYEIIQE